MTTNPPDGNEAAPALVPEAVIDDLRSRLRSYRRVPLPAGHGWERGTDGDYLESLLTYWLDSYDWKEHESRIRGMPWALTQADSGAVRAIHQRSADPEAIPVLLLHGWPDSVLRFERLLPLLNDVHVVVPALPGFPFAARIPQGGLSAVAIADTVKDAMSRFGYKKFVISAGDVGCDVAEAMAGRYPEAVLSMHLTDVSQYHFLADLPANLSTDEEAYVRQGRDWQAREGGYMHEQSTKPHTLAVALGDSPAGLAAWLVEKLRSWTDSNGDVESVFPRDDLLTWITAYWVTEAIGTSFTPYAEAADKSTTPVAPVVFTIFPKDLVNAPQEFARRHFTVASWHEMPAGGHFAAWEYPQDYAQGVHDAVRIAALDENREVLPLRHRSRTAPQVDLAKRNCAP